MARKTTKKPAKKKPSKASVKKAGAKKAGTKNAAPARASRGPTKISTGRGPAPAEVGGDLVAMFNRGQLKEIEEKWYSPDIVSVEGVGVSMAWTGRKAMKEKNDEWTASHRIHGASAEGPFVGATGFAVKFAMDVEDTSRNSRSMFEEVGVYTVQNGKIVREEFMYGRATPISGITVPG